MPLERRNLNTDLEFGAHILHQSVCEVHTGFWKSIPPMPDGALASSLPEPLHHYPGGG